MSSFNSKIIRKQMSDDLKKRLAQLNAVINAGQQSAQRKLPIGPKDLVAHVEGWDTFKSTVGTFFRLAVVANQYGSLYADVKKIKGRDAYSWTVEAIDIELHEESMSGEEETLAQAKCTAVCKMGEVMQDFAQSRGLHARIDWSKVHDVK